jgi:hypothetical protein
VIGGKLIAVLLQSIREVSSINPLVAFNDMEEKERCYSFILSRTPYEYEDLFLKKQKTLW